MQYEVVKVDNCFAESQTYEYRLPVDGQAFCARLTGWEVKENHKFRRPLFSADRDGINIKGILRANTVKVSFPDGSWEAGKADFESWLGSLPLV